MKKRIIAVLVLLLSGCFDDTSDLRAYMEQVKEGTSDYVEEMPKISEFKHFEYSAQHLRSPFVKPKAEAILEKIQQTVGCPVTPIKNRRKQPLEKYSLADLFMRGTLGELNVTWALIEASDHTLHRVAVGQYLGLYNGRVTQVNPDNIVVTELVPDGSGCWAERNTTIAMVDADTEGQRN